MRILTKPTFISGLISGGFIGLSLYDARDYVVGCLKVTGARTRLVAIPDTVKSDDEMCHVIRVLNAVYERKYNPKNLMDIISQLRSSGLAIIAKELKNGGTDKYIAVFVTDDKDVGYGFRISGYDDILRMQPYMTSHVSNIAIYKSNGTLHSMNGMGKINPINSNVLRLIEDKLPTMIDLMSETPYSFILHTPLSISEIEKSIKKSMQGGKNHTSNRNQVIHTGPNGGKYRLIKGKKVYVRIYTKRN